MCYFKEDSTRLVKPPPKFSGGLAKLGIISLVKQDTERPLPGPGWSYPDSCHRRHQFHRCLGPAGQCSDAANSCPAGSKYLGEEESTGVNLVRPQQNGPHWLEDMIKFIVFNGI